jgi:hypothetical protein
MAPRKASVAASGTRGQAVVVTSQYMARIAYGDYVMSCDHTVSKILIYHLEMIFINGRIKKTVVHHILDCPSAAHLSVSVVTSEGISRVYRISESRTVELEEPSPMRLDITWIGTPFGKLGALSRIRIIMSLLRGPSEE